MPHVLRWQSRSGRQAGGLAADQPGDDHQVIGDAVIGLAGRLRRQWRPGALVNDAGKEI